MPFFSRSLARNSQSLRDWAAINKVIIHEGVDIGFSSGGSYGSPGKEVGSFFRGRKGLYCPVEAEMPVVLLKVPRRVLLTEANILEQFECDTDLQALFSAASCKAMREGAMVFLLAQLGYAAAVPGPTAAGVKSPWYGYVSFLPKDVPVPTLWDESSRLRLTGTSLEQSVDAKVQALRKEYQDFRANIASVPFWRGLFKELTEEAWFLADAWYRSRSLELPRSGHALVPMVDMVNHSDKPTAYWEENEAGDVSLLLRRGALIPAGHEITISYGDRSKAEMLYNYGFFDLLAYPHRLRIPFAPTEYDLDMPKMVAFGQPPWLEVARDATGCVSWTCPFAWLQELGVADGLEVKMDGSTDGSQRVRLLWNGGDVTDQARDFEKLIPSSYALKLRVTERVKRFVTSKLSRMLPRLLPDSAMGLDSRSPNHRQFLANRLLSSEIDLLEALRQRLDQ